MKGCGDEVNQVCLPEQFAKETNKTKERSSQWRGCLLIKHSSLSAHPTFALGQCLTTLERLGTFAAEIATNFTILKGPP